MLQTTWLLFTLLPIAFLRCDAFCPTIRSFVKQTQRCAVKQPRQEFLDSLSLPYELNENNPSRTQLLKKLIESESKPGGSSLANPGGVETFAAVAPGAWKVVYAPHMTIAAGLLKGDFRVQYDLREDGTMTSHARYNFPLFNLWGYLSVSGTYGSVNDTVCRVDFDEAWYRPFNDDFFLDGPYPTVNDVPESLTKKIIRQVGKALFIEPFAVFPVSYLDNELIVFDFELLGTRICARKEC